MPQNLDGKPVIFPLSLISGTLLHGSAGRFKEFSAKYRGSVTESSDAAVAVWLTTSPPRAKFAAEEAEAITGNKAHIMNVLVDVRSPLVISSSIRDYEPSASARLIKCAWDKGHDAVIFPGEMQGFDIAIKDESQTRIVDSVWPSAMDRQVAKIHTVRCHANADRRA